jgi:hypothetical protein
MYTALTMESKLEKVAGKQFAIANKTEQIIKAGEEYALKTNVFHESLHSGNTITVVRKIKDPDMNGLCEIKVLCEKGQTPSESYDRKDIDSATLWAKVEAAITNA